MSTCNRNYLCLTCGAIRRAPGRYYDEDFLPSCCNLPMQGLSYEQTVAATHLEKDKRAEWMKNGGRVVKGKGRRRWKAAN